MIRTVTLSTGFDEFYTVSGVVFGGVSNVISHTTMAAGKGVNAARVVHILGDRVTAYALVGQSDRAHFERLLKQDGVDSRLVFIDHETRHNLTVLDASSTSPAAHFMGPRFVLDDEEPIKALMEKLEHDIQAGDLVTLHGSVPQGVDHSVWVKIGKLALEKGAALLVDTYAEPLIHALENLQIEACKPNQEEIQIIPGVSGKTGEEAASAALRYMAAKSVSLPIVSLGANGLRFAMDGQIWSATYPVQHPRIQVGPGDACVAGLAVLLNEGKPLMEIIRSGVAAAVAHVEGIEPSLFRERASTIIPEIKLQRLEFI